MDQNHLETLEKVDLIKKIKIHKNNPYKATDELLELIANLPGK